MSASRPAAILYHRQTQDWPPAEVDSDLDLPSAVRPGGDREGAHDHTAIGVGHYTRLGPFACRLEPARTVIMVGLCGNCQQVELLPRSVELYRLRSSVAWERDYHAMDFGSPRAS